VHRPSRSQRRLLYAQIVLSYYFIRNYRSCFGRLGTVAAPVAAVTSTNGRFEAIFPAAPTTSSSAKDTPNGKMINNLVSADTNDSAFLISYADWPSAIPDVHAALLASQNSVLKDMNATLLISKSTNVSGYQALVYRVRMPQATGEVYVGSVLVLFVGRRQYQVVVVQPESKAPTEEESKFLSSFKLVA
jgi:hypothetical protein